MFNVGLDCSLAPLSVASITSPTYPAGIAAPVAAAFTGPWTYSALFDGWSSGDNVIVMSLLKVTALHFPTLPVVESNSF